MAEKRMISKVISISKKFNIRLDDHFSRLLYILLIPHSDDFGRLTGDAFKIKALILPMMDDVKWNEVEETLGKLHAAELIIWYEVSGEKYIQIINFDEHQQGLHKRTRSKFPEPPHNSRNFSEIPPEGKGRELNRTELKGTDTEGKGTELPTPDSNPHKDRIHALINECGIQDYNLHHLDIVFSYIGVVDIEVIEVAIKKSTKKSGSYLANTLHGMVTKDGITKKEQVLPKPKAGEPNGANGEGVRQGGTSIHDQPIKGPVGLLPSKYATNVLQMPKVSG